MSRKLSATEVKIMLAGIAKLPPDDVTGYVVVYVKDDDVSLTVSNAADRPHEIGVLARAIEYAAAALAEERAH